MAVNLDESNYFKFIIVSDKPKPSKNKFTEKPSKGKDNKNTKTSTSNNSENPMDEKKPNETNKQTVPEVQVNDDTSDNKGDSTEEQKNKDQSSPSVQNNLSIEVPSKSTSSEQLVNSPSDIKAASESSFSAISPTVTQRSTKTEIFKNVGKKFGNMIKKDNGAQTTGSNTIPEQGDATTSDATVQVQQKQVIKDADNATPESTPESIPEGLANSKDNTENKTNDAISKDEIRKEGNDKKPTSQRTNSLSKFANMKLFLTRTSSVLVEKLEEKFDELDKRIYPDIDPNWAAENDAKINRSRDVNDKSAINEREQLLENQDISPKGEVTNGSQKVQSTQDVLADVGVALNERQEKLNNLAESTEKLSRNTSHFAELAAQLRKDQEQKSSKPWKFW